MTRLQAAATRAAALASNGAAGAAANGSRPALVRDSGRGRGA